MAGPRSFPSRRAALTEALLTDCHGAPVTVSSWSRLAPWTVARARLDGPAGVPRDVVVKWARDQPVPGRTPGGRLRTEVAALRFLADDLGLALAPRVLAADPDAGLVVLEDLAPRVALDGLLRRDGAAAHAERLAAFARARGELGAATAGHDGAYYARRAALGPVDRAADRRGRYAPLREEAHGHADAFGAPITGPAAAELTHALAELCEPGPFLVLSNDDAEANNALVHPTGPADPRLIDFEFAGYTHALHDAVGLYVPGPAWMSVGDPVASGLADVHRTALAAGVPQAADDRRYGFGLAAACLAFALVRLERLPRLDARPPGDPSRPQLVATLEAAARTADAHRALPHLAGWAHRTAALLRRRWPDADLDPAALPPYTPRGGD
ncbi:hypothetical protein [Streptomyces sp. NEAU-NA10]|uniref:hypothetical protein n=1 Tax=Streptomyces sp. NEAU-NA10 TaxID=3416050 RepID=UPI003CC6CA7A